MFPDLEDNRSITSVFSTLRTFDGHSPEICFDIYFDPKGDGQGAGYHTVFEGINAGKDGDGVGCGLRCHREQIGFINERRGGRISDGNGGYLLHKGSNGAGWGD